MTSLVFTDMSVLTTASAKFVRAQANFNAAAKLCGLVMKPLHDALQDADQALKQALNTAAGHEADGTKFDLNALLAVAQDEQAVLAQQAALAASQQSANDAT